MPDHLTPLPSVIDNAAGGCIALTAVHHSRNHRGMPQKLYPFRFRDPVTGKWVRARYKATRDDIGRRYASARIDGEGAAPPGVSIGFDPFRQIMPSRPLRLQADAPPLLHPELTDALERFLVASFLRRYVTWCARRGRFAAMNGAAALLRHVSRGGAPGSR